MYCTHCGAEYKKSWRMPSRCRECHAEVTYEPRGWLTVILIVSMAIGAAIGWLTLRVFEGIDPAGGETSLFGRFLAPLLAVIAILAAYQLVGRLFLLAGILKSKDLAAEKPAEVEAHKPRSGRRLTTQQQIAFNLSKVNLPGQGGSQNPADEGNRDGANVARRRVQGGVRIGTQAGMPTAAQPHASTGGGQERRSPASTRHGARTSFSDALYATRKATEEQYSGEAKTTQLVSEARDELIRASKASAERGRPSAQVGQKVTTVTHTGTYDEVRANDVQGIREMGALSSAIVKEHFDPIIGPEQNDYMITHFNTAEAITNQLQNQGYRYFFVCDPKASASASARERHIGFMAFYLRETEAGERELYLSKFYLEVDKRGQGLSHDMCRFVVDQARALGCRRVVLNVNRNNYQAILAYEHLGFRKVHEEKNDIGHGYFMDDLVYELPVA